MRSRPVLDPGNHTHSPCRGFRVRPSRTSSASKRGDSSLGPPASHFHGNENCRSTHTILPRCHAEKRMLDERCPHLLPSRSPAVLFGYEADGLSLECPPVKEGLRAVHQCRRRRGDLLGRRSTGPRIERDRRDRCLPSRHRRLATRRAAAHPGPAAPVASQPVLYNADRVYPGQRGRLARVRGGLHVGPRRAERASPD
jgi:hypothetical protein